MQLPLRANFADKSSQETVRGIIRVADDQSLELWKGWRYRTNHEDRAWDWRMIYRECRVSRGR